MSRLPNCAQAVVPVEKVRDYLLNEAHPEGASKARFFRRFGFGVEEYGVFQEAIQSIACTGNMIKIAERPPYGTRYVMRAKLPTPDGRNPEVTVSWFIGADDATYTPRLATVVLDKTKRP